MCSCTEKEANHYGRFLCSILEVVSRWHKDEKVFDQECAKFPGFVTKFTEKDPVHVDYESYRHVCHKWHYRLTKAFILCLDSENYIQIRNSLFVLIKINPFFPVIASFAQAIEKRVEATRNNEKDKRPDLFALATSYAGKLRLKKPSFVAEGEFHLKAESKTKKSTPPASEVRPTEPEGPAPPPTVAVTIKKDKDSPREGPSSFTTIKAPEVVSNGKNGSSEPSVKPTSRIVSTSNIRLKKDSSEINDNGKLSTKARDASKSSSSKPKSSSTGDIEDVKKSDDRKTTSSSTSSASLSKKTEKESSTKDTSSSSRGPKRDRITTVKSTERESKSSVGDEPPQKIIKTSPRRGDRSTDNGKDRG